ncbi:MAG TPA: N-formylglutamate amidohydrolase [Pseudomonadales bacterium]|nr:N-formylglutamate amidohydrolase [Pseudomonadales bacterium]
MPDVHSSASVAEPKFDLHRGDAPLLICIPHAGTQVPTEIRAQLSDAALVLQDTFKGGYITRHYGAPVHGIQAIQLEMCQYLYMSENAPFEYEPDLAVCVRRALRAMPTTALEHLPHSC